MLVVAAVGVVVSLALLLSLFVADGSGSRTTTTTTLRRTTSDDCGGSKSRTNRPNGGVNCGGGGGGEGAGAERRILVPVDGDTTTTTSPPTTVSSYFQWETSLWTQRNLKADVALDVDAFEVALQEASQRNCDLGITATLFDAGAAQIFQSTVGTKYNTLEEDGGNSELVDGWTDTTTFALYSNSKIFATALFVAAVVDTGRGYLDEPLSQSLKDVAAYGNLTRSDSSSRVGRITPRMILSHRTGIRSYNRNTADDPFYAQCLFDATRSLTDCVAEFLLQDEFLLEDPGTFVRYNNDPFYILAEVILAKTGRDDLDQALREYITDPIGMTASYDCPLVKSTSAKPHVSWGICSTGADAPKLIQVLANRGQTPDGSKRIVSADSVNQILSFQAGAAGNADVPIATFPVPLNNCLSRTGRDPPNSLIGYGLGTMITAGVKGQLFVHAATVGGFWVIAPNKYAAYFAWMKRGAFPATFAWMARIIDRFERASTFRVSNAWDDDGEWNEITACVDGMFIDSTTVDDAATVLCPGEEETPTAAPSSSKVSPTGSPTASPATTPSTQVSPTLSPTESPTPSPTNTTAAPVPTSDAPRVKKCNLVTWVLQVMIGWFTGWLGLSFCDLGA